jgi:hypothetical protein
VQSLETIRLLALSAALRHGKWLIPFITAIRIAYTSTTNNKIEALVTASKRLFRSLTEKQMLTPVIESRCYVAEEVGSKIAGSNSCRC